MPARIPRQDRADSLDKTARIPRQGRAHEEGFLKRILAEGQDPLSESSLGSQPGISGPSGTPQHSDPEGLDEDSARPRAKSLVGLASGH